MAEYTAIDTQTVAAGSNVLFSETAVKSCCSVTHREGSGVFTLHGGKKYIVGFNANVANPTAVTPISFAIAISGEQLQSTTMIYTPAAANEFGNISAFAEICVPKCCCYNIAVENTSGTSATTQNANLIIERVEV